MAVSAEIRIIDTERPYENRTYELMPTHVRTTQLREDESGGSTTTVYEFDFEYSTIDVHHRKFIKEEE